MMIITILYLFQTTKKKRQIAKVTKSVKTTQVNKNFLKLYKGTEFSAKAYDLK